MRILTVNVHYAPESYGGATIVAESVTRELGERDHDVYVVTSTQPTLVPGSGFYRYQDGNTPVVAIARMPGSGPLAEYTQPLLGERFLQILDSVRPDIVHFHAMQSLGVDMVEQAVSRVPTVVTLHDAWWLCERQFMVRSTGQWCGQSGIDPRVCATCVPDPAAHEQRQSRSLSILNACTQVLTPSRYWANVMAASGIDPSLIRVNRNGVQHPPEGYSRTQHRGPVRFGYVGGDNSIKGAPQLRQALHGLRRTDYELRLVDSVLNLGHQSLFPQDWQFPGLVEIVPGYDSATMDGFFESIDVLLFPSQCPESYGLTVREAILRGVWVVATEGGGTTEELEHGLNAHLLPLDGSSEALRAAMEDILDDPQRYVGRARPLRRIPTFADQALELEQIYAECLLE